MLGHFSRGRPLSRKAFDQLSIIGNVPEEGLKLFDEVPKALNCLLALRGEGSPAALLPALLCDNERSQSKGVDLFHQKPGVSVTDYHRPCRRRNRPALLNTLEQDYPSPGQVGSAVLFDPNPSPDPQVSDRRPFEAFTFRGVLCRSRLRTPNGHTLPDQAPKPL